MTAETPPTPRKTHRGRKPIYPANYGDATFSDVTRAMLRYRPDKARKAATGKPRETSS